jgi:hypothetical protein
MAQLEVTVKSVPSGGSLSDWISGIGRRRRYVCVSLHAIGDDNAAFAYVKGSKTRSGFNGIHSDQTTEPASTKNRPPHTSSSRPCRVATGIREIAQQAQQSALGEHDGISQLEIVG